MQRSEIYLEYYGDKQTTTTTLWLTVPRTVCHRIVSNRSALVERLAREHMGTRLLIQFDCRLFDKYIIDPTDANVQTQDLNGGCV